MAQLNIRLLGNPEITLDREPVSTDRRKAVALLAYLAVTGQSHSREHLATLFWPDADQSRALAYLRRTLWEINNMLGDSWLDVSRDNVTLPLTADSYLDTAVFSAALDHLNHHQPDLDVLADAAARYRSDFMAGFTLRDSPGFDDWQLLQSQSFRLGLGQLLEALITGYETREQWRAAESAARRWLTLDPLQEAAHRALMRLHARQGQRVLALRQYEACVATLEDELGMAPSPETVALAAAIRAGDFEATAVPETAVAAVDAAPVRRPVGATPASFLPALPTAFVGRSAELADISALLTAGESRLLTLMGPGGSGKTRLAIEAARQNRDNFADGIWFVGLASLTTPDQLVPAIANTLGFRLEEESGAVTQQLCDYLRQKRLLLVLDNVEHLLTAGITTTISNMLATAPQLQLLTTSRERLQLRGERLYRVTGMTVPSETAVSAEDVARMANGDYSAVQLFVQSARLVQPDFELAADNVAAVAGICRLVEGMPLGIELAAGWLALLTPAEVQAEIQRSFDFLATEMQDVPARQRSLRTVFDYSWELLTPAEKRIFPLLAIFTGGFTRETVTAVTDASLQSLMGLVNKSLVRRQANGRFYIHELLRQYATEKLQAEPETWLAIRHAHADHFLSWLIDTTPQMKGPAQKEAFDAVEAEISNIRAAWLWHVVHKNYMLPRRALSGLFIYNMVRGTLGELRGLLDIVIDDVEAEAEATAVDAAGPTSAQLFHAALLGLLSYTASEAIISEKAIHYSQKAIACMHKIGLEGDLTLPYILASSTYAWRVDREEGLRYAQNALDVMRANGDEWYLALFLLIVSGLYWSLRQRDHAKEMLEEGVTLSREIGDELLLSLSLGNLAGLLVEEQQYEHALTYQEECCQIHRRLNNLQGLAKALYFMGSICDTAGWYERGLAYYRQGLPIFTEIGNRLSVAATYSYLSLTQRRLGRIEEAMVSRRQAAAIFHEVDDTNGIAWSHYEMGDLYRIQGKLAQAEAQIAQAQEIFEAHSTESGPIQIGLSFCYRSRGHLALMNGNLDEAETWLRQSLDYGEKAYDEWGLSNAHYVLGLLALAREQIDTAETHMRQALLLGKLMGNQGAVMQALVGLARWALAAKQTAEAVRLAATIAAAEIAWAETRKAAVAILAAAGAEDGQAAANADDLIYQYLPA